jgi:uncharacterized membrane protein YdfJ with MMPL/SSD domain
LAPKLGATAAIGMWSARHRKTALIGWLLFVVFVSTAGSLAGGNVNATTLENGVGESGRAALLLDQAGVASPASEVVLIESDTITANDPAFADAVADVIGAVRATGLATDVHSPYDTGAVSADGHSALVDFTMRDEPLTAAGKVQPLLDAVAASSSRHPGVRADEFGEASGQKLITDSFTNDFKKAEWTAVPLALIILLVAFAALVAAVVPVVLALTAYIGAAGLLALVSHVTHTTNDAMSVMLLVGLAVGVDYCLFYLRREREERAAGRDLHTALTIAAATSGRAVVVSGLTVAVAMAGMLFTGITDFKAMGVAAVLVVLVAVAGSVTVLPALLSLLGDRVDRGRIPFLGKRRAAADAAVAAGRPAGGRLWNAILRPVLARPLVATVLATLALLAMSVPLLTIRTAQLNFSQELSPHSAIVQTGKRIQAAFPGLAAPAKVVVRAPDVQDPRLTRAVDDFRREALATGRMHEPIVVRVHPDQHIVELTVPLAGTGNDDASNAALNQLRGTVIPRTIGTVAGVETAVTGSTAQSADFNRRLGRAVVPVFSFVLVLAFVLMLASFRSLTVAITTTLLNLLSVGAAYGVLTVVFQHGYGESLLGGHNAGAVMSWVPLFLFVILFGLSMDYHVFVVSRIKEGFDRGLTAKAAVAHGIRSTAGVVTSAAVIMVGIFSIFGTLSLESMKQISVGLAAAVLLDATIIRGVLLPATMTLLGDRNWYLPRVLNRIPDLSHREVYREPQPVAVPAAIAAPVRESEPVPV